MSNRPKLRRLHPDSTILANSSSVTFWESQPTYVIVQSLRRGQPEPLIVKHDGTVVQGNTRIYVLEQRNYDLTTLPWDSHESNDASYFYDM